MLAIQMHFDNFRVAKAKKKRTMFEALFTDLYKAVSDADDDVDADDNEICVLNDMLDYLHEWQNRAKSWAIWDKGIMQVFACTIFGYC